mmetsp:Transcript_12342/g.34818  ORF Transcript_12342/g.34818 Transcript_12342/m.34818 type:complete len:510 (-) Transcript_12342:406-1935(-)
MVTQSSRVSSATRAARSSVRHSKVRPNTCCKAGSNRASHLSIFTSGTTSLPCCVGYCTEAGGTRFKGTNVTRPPLVRFSSCTILVAVASVSTTTWNSALPAAVSRAVLRAGAHSKSSRTGPKHPWMPCSSTSLRTLLIPRRASREPWLSRPRSLRCRASCALASFSSKSAPVRHRSFLWSHSSLCSFLMRASCSISATSSCSCSSSKPWCSPSAVFCSTRLEPSSWIWASTLRRLSPFCRRVARMSFTSPATQVSLSRLLEKWEPWSRFWFSACSLRSAASASPCSRFSRAWPSSTAIRASASFISASATCCTTPLRSSASTSRSVCLSASPPCTSATSEASSAWALMAVLRADWASSTSRPSPATRSSACATSSSALRRSRCTWQARSCARLLLAPASSRAESMASSLPLASCSCWSYRAYSIDRHLRSSSWYRASSSRSEASSLTLSSKYSSTCWISSFFVAVSCRLRRLSSRRSSYTRVPATSLISSRRSWSRIVAISAILPCCTM